MSEIKLVLDDSAQQRKLDAVAADVERLLLATVKPHIEFTIGPITKQERKDNG